MCLTEDKPDTRAFPSAQGVAEYESQRKVVAHWSSGWEVPELTWVYGSLLLDRGSVPRDVYSHLVPSEVVRDAKHHTGAVTIKVHRSAMGPRQDSNGFTRLLFVPQSCSHSIQANLSGYRDFVFVQPGQSSLDDDLTEPVVCLLCQFTQLMKFSAR